MRYRPKSWGANAPKWFVSIGRHGVVTADQARTKARALFGQAADNKDPASERAARRDELTVSGLIDRYIEVYVDERLKPRTAEGYRHLLRAYVQPAIGRQRVTDVVPGDLDAIHRKLKERRYTANRMLAVTQAMYSWASGEAGLLPKGFNPAANVPRYSEAGRERFLTNDELKRLEAALREAETIGLPWQVDETKKGAKHLAKDENRRTVLSPHATTAIRLLLFTGARLRENLNLKWVWVDFERGVFRLPDSKTGKKAIVLNAPAVATLTELPRVGQYVIAGEDPDKPRPDIKRPWSQVRRAAGLEDLRLRDLRHSFASVGAGGGLDLYIIGSLLGHTQAATTQRYAHLADDPVRRASERIGQDIAAALGDGLAGGGSVVPIGHARKAKHD